MVKTKIAALHVIYNFIVDDIFIWVDALMFIFISRILRIIFWLFQATSDIYMVYPLL
jgi:hypothetical protein